MQLTLYWGWDLLALPGLSLLYGWAACRAMKAFGYSLSCSARRQLWVALPTFLVSALWCVTNISLPLFYALAFALKLVFLLWNRDSRAKELFIVNISHLGSSALHIILIGTAALALGQPMWQVLQQPFWRVFSLCFVIFANAATDLLIPRWGMPLTVVRAQSGNKEVRPFMAFLWSCNFFLLLDSLLCVYPIEWDLLPLFLIGSTLLLEFYIFRFLRHIYSILQVQYLEDEHLRLMAELERRNRTAAELRHKSYVDPLTQVFSRRYLTEQISFLLKKREPFCLAFIDLDHLKMVNDQEGHHAGDLYLIQFAKAFGSCLRKTDIFARVGGDEFVALLPGCTQGSAQGKMEHIRSYLAQGEGRALSFSYGLAFVPRSSNESAEQVLRRADQAMYRDKARCKA